MTRLNQVLAAAKDVKSSTLRAVTEAYHQAQKATLFNGITREYSPLDDAGEQLPAESQLVQQKVPDVHKRVARALSRLWATVGTIDATNQLANADVKVGDVTLLTGVPSTHLLFLEKQLQDLHAYVSALPLLDPASTWTWDAGAQVWRSDTVKTVRSRKVAEVVVLYPATDKHPAQTAMHQRDETAGHWSTTKLSGAIPVAEQRKMLERLGELQRAVKSAREEANTATTVEFDSSELLTYLFDWNH